MSSTYSTRNATTLPCDFLYYARLIQILSETKRFDCLVKMNVPTSGCLLKLINGLLQLAYQVILSVGYKTFWLLYIDVLEIAIQECSLNVHLPDLII